MAENEINEVVTIQLHRGSSGLGFNIRGGKDQSHLPNDHGIFVTKIRETGAAAQDGTLEEGDKIIEINGSNMENLNHNDAVNLFLSAGDDVTLKIWRGAERIRMDEYARYLDELKAAKQRKVILATMGSAVLVFALVYYRKNIFSSLKDIVSKLGFGSSV
ncbi:synaptojanin-2-binding protein-like [Styela clava]|uniref:synaptojanin-2-binding protein-like n=1 Tax=Styela clava TaxID=7725 RepID=UPI00193973E4|nr:synaptojanin-2-binding protein-like [Styela clava]